MNLVPLKHSEFVYGLYEIENENWTELMIIQELPHPTRKRLVPFDTGCRRLAAAFTRNDSVDKLIEEFEIVEQIWEGLKDELPSSQSLIFAARHIYFIRYWLDENQPTKCESDVSDLIRKDIPGIIKSVDLAAGNPHYHPAIVTKVFPPLERQEFDSAIRRVFTVLKSELIEQFQLSKDLDGEALYNACFGNKGAAIALLGESECQALRNYLSGLSVLYRNHFAHNDVDGEWTETAAVISGVNMILLRLKTLSGLPDDSQIEGA